MSGDNTISRWEANTTDYGDHGLLTDISLTLINMSSKNRTKHRQQKLRQELVREYFEQEQRPKTRLQSILGKFSNS